MLDLDEDGAPLLSIFGGKITTARRLAEDALARLGPALGIDVNPVTRARVFPGGEIADVALFLARVRATWPFLGETRSERMARAYGTRLGEMLHGLDDAAGLGGNLGGGMTEIEARWMRQREWAKTPEDALYRRSKIGLHLTAQERAAFARWWESQT